jgi:hypothetical protein
MTTLKVKVKRVFGQKRISNAQTETGEEDSFTIIDVLKTGDDTILDVKGKIAEAIGGQVKPDDLFLQFSPNDRKLGRQYVNDPTVDESSLKLKDFWVLEWLERFPHWSLSVSLLPPTPPPPGVAIQKAAATAENKDPEMAVNDARKKGEIPQMKDLPAPWGPKEFVPPSRDVLMEQGYVPAEYASGYSPLVDIN